MSTETRDGMKERVLYNLITKAGHPAPLQSVRLVEGLDQRYTIYIRVLGKPHEYIVTQYQTTEVKRYKDAQLAICRIRAQYGYWGTITVESERFEPTKPRRPKFDGRGDADDDTSD